MIYSDVARTLRDARGYASSVAQLRMIDRVAYMLADTLADYKRFNPETFYTQAEVGNGIPIIETELTHE